MGQIREVMTERPKSASSETTVREVAGMMAQEDVGPIPVVDGERLVGIVTDRDLVVRVLAEGRDPDSTTVGEVASGDPVSVSPDADIEEALELLAENQVRRLLVVEHDRLVGIVAQADIARLGKDEKTGELVEDISR